MASRNRLLCQKPLRDISQVGVTVLLCLYAAFRRSSAGKVTFWPVRADAECWTKEGREGIQST